jgi:cyanophycinase-like exopeptidase
MAAINPGPIALFGSGETAPAGRRVHSALFERLDSPISVAVMETPAGFQPNSAWVAGRLAEFVEESLANFHPRVTVVPARRRDGNHSTDDPKLNAPLLDANYIFMGPGSPTYAARHLADTWAWHVIVARQRRGLALALASAAAIAVGTHALPVYEIYKAGADLFWTSGLDLFRPYGLELVVVTHWDNRDGGENLDTRRAFMGVERMARLESMLPPSATMLGIDEHTAAILDFAVGSVEVTGLGTVTVCRRGEEEVFGDGEAFPMETLGPARLPEFDEGIDDHALEAVLAAEEVPGDELPHRVRVLVQEREAARRDREWAKADALRDQVADLGYAIEDTPDGPRWRRI